MHTNDIRVSFQDKARKVLRFQIRAAEVPPRCVLCYTVRSVHLRSLMIPDNLRYKELQKVLPKTFNYKNYPVIHHRPSLTEQEVAATLAETRGDYDFSEETKRRLADRLHILVGLGYTCMNLRDDLASLTHPGRYEGEEKAGNYRVYKFKHLTVYRCMCGRDVDTYVPRSTYLGSAIKSMAEKYHSTCKICELDAKSAHTPTQQISAALRRAYTLVNTEDHLHFDKEPTRCSIKGVCMRPRRAIYSNWFGETLGVRDFVKQMCDDPTCINPLHMEVSGSCRTKLGKRVRQEIRSWLALGHSPSTVVGLVELNYGIKVTKRTIQRIKKDGLE